MITIEPARVNRSTESLVSTLVLRVQAIIRHTPEDMAFRTLAALQGMAPDDIKGYPALLRVYRFKIRGQDAAGIMAPGYANSYRLSRADAQRTVLYVKPRSVAGVVVDPAATVLWRSNPWTMGTLPYEPNRREASILSRRVSAREAEKIEKRRLAERPAIDRELVELGKDLSRRDPVLLDRRVTRDLAFEVLRREFGLGDAPHVAHWRPAVRLARTSLPKAVLKSYLRWFTVPSEQRWKKPLKAKVGKPAEAAKVGAFQSYLRG